MTVGIGIKDHKVGQRHREWQEPRGVRLLIYIKEGFSDEVAFGQKPKPSKGTSHSCIWKKRLLGRNNNKAKALKSEQ